MIFNMAKEEWQAVLAVHLDGTFYCTRAASVHMREEKYGRIISMLSVSALGALCHRLLGRPASGSGRLCHGDGGHEGAGGAGGRAS
jgi:NAD(P)-dependent dehydrogenase (short-subunit alcohol dehydrogenase family)